MTTKCWVENEPKLTVHNKHIVCDNGEELRLTCENTDKWPRRCWHSYKKSDRPDSRSYAVREWDQTDYERALKSIDEDPGCYLTTEAVYGELDC